MRLSREKSPGQLSTIVLMTFKIIGGREINYIGVWTLPFLEDVGGLWCHAIDTPIRLPMSVTNRNGKATEIPTNHLDGAV